MTFDEWRARHATYGVPVFAMVEQPATEHNDPEDMFSPSLNNTALGKELQAHKEDIPPTYDGIKIEDMKDAEFAAARFAPNKLDAMDAAVRYQRKFVGKYKDFTSALKRAQKGRR